MFEGIFEKMRIEVIETYDQFIFDTIQPWLQEKTQQIVDKQLLIDALVEYRQRHPERFISTSGTEDDEEEE